MSTKTATKHPRQKRGEGQWALGYHEPLNGNEEQKKNDDGLNVRSRIEHIYAQHGFDSIDPADLRGRFRWYGLYTQRRPGIDGGRTAVLEPEELEDRYFMMRIRIPGGQLDLAQLRTIAEISTTYGRGLADITDRQNIQLHWVEIEHVPTIWAMLDAVGLSTTEACGDTPRNMLADPVAGIDADEIIDPTWALTATEQRYRGDPAFSNLPRKYKTLFAGGAYASTVHEINDVSFVGVLGPDGTPGFDLWVGGGLSTNPMFAQRLGAFVPEEQVPEVWAGVTSVFRDYGYRRLRSRARLKFLVKDWGAERFREVLEKEYLGYHLMDCAAPATSGRRDYIGPHRQHDGRFYVGVAPKVGRVSAETLYRLADLAERHGSGRVRTTIEQKLVVLDVPEEHVEPLIAGLEEIDLPARPSTFRLNTMACTGIEFCKLAIVETKARAMSLIDELERRLPNFDEPLTVNLNGCPNSCARIQVADIGLKGQLVTDADGNQVPGYQVHLGGTYTRPDQQAGLGRKVRGLKVTAAELPDYIERMVLRFQAGRQGSESFAQWVARAPEGELT